MSGLDVSENAIERVRFGSDGLIPAIVQDATSGQVLTLAWMNRESLERTIAEGRTWFWSRSRGELSNKGAVRGNIHTAEYESGHMMYTNLPDLQKMQVDITSFIKASVAK